jgi:hypothetical protein
VWYQECETITYNVDIGYVFQFDLRSLIRGLDITLKK